MQEQLDEVTGLSRKVDHRVEGRGRCVRASRSRTSTARPLKLPSGEQRGALLPAGRREHRRQRRRPRSRPATSSPRSRARPRRPRTSPAVCRASPSCSRRASRRTTRSSPRSTARCSFGKDTKGKRKVVDHARASASPREYLIPKGKHLTVREGDRVRAGEPLMDGPPNPHDILKVLGEKALAKYLVDEIQEVYRLQGVQHQRQAHRGHRAADAAPRPRQGRRATRTSWSTSRSRSTSSRRRTSA